MFNWFNKKEEKIDQTVESVNTTHPLMASVEKILNKTNISPKEVFEEFVRKTYRDNLNSLFQYNVKCSRLNLDEELLRISYVNNAVCFYHIDGDTFYYVQQYDKNVPEDRDFCIVNSFGFSILLTNYINFLDTTEDLFTHTKERLS